MPDPFEVDQDRAIAALQLAWGDSYSVTVTDGRWQARHKDAGSVLTGDTPDALNIKIGADWNARS